MMKDEMAWEKFRKFQNFGSADSLNFYGCVNEEGVWFDSATSFDIAAHWCCYAYNQFDLTNEQEIEWMNTEGMRLGLSIIHGSMIKRLYEAGLIK